MLGRLLQGSTRVSNLKHNHWLIIGIIALVTALVSAPTQNVDAMQFELLQSTYVAEAAEHQFIGDEREERKESTDETTESEVELTTEEYVRAYFSDIPVMQDIAWCESRFRHYDSTGKPLRNMQGSSAIGVMQIMSSLHQEPAQRLGHDITTLEGNMAYARHLYERNGTRDWNASRHCWEQKRLARN